MSTESFSQKVTTVVLAVAALGVLAAVITLASLGKNVPSVLLTIAPLVVGVLVPSPAGHSGLLTILSRLTLTAPVAVAPALPSAPSPVAAAVPVADAFPGDEPTTVVTVPVVEPAAV
jgi:TRAP-type uncharacterized transport system fused permease subunit